MLVQCPVETGDTVAENDVAVRELPLRQMRRPAADEG
jgi:hypothetical protein